MAREKLNANLFEGEPVKVRAPGRFNLIGEHTDYNMGLVMPGAIDKCINIDIGIPQGDKNSIHVYAVNFDEHLRTSVSSIKIEMSVTWKNYILAIVEILQERGHQIGGFNAIFKGNIPIGAGLSSSAALCCGMIIGLSELFNLNLNRRTIALIAQAAEHRIGLKCGLMDQYAVLFGKKDHVILLDCKRLEFDYIPIETKHHALILIDSLVRHALAAESGYNDRWSTCQEVVRKAKERFSDIQSLSEMSLPMLDTIKPELSTDEYRKAGFVIRENARVNKVGQALKRNNMDELGRYLNESHVGLRDNYDVTSEETDLLQEICVSQHEVLGARQVGGGFGGCILALVEKENKALVCRRTLAKYRERTHREAKIIDVIPSTGVHVV